MQGRISKTRSGNASDYYWKTFNYDGNGNIIQTQTPLGIVEKWTFDALNRNISYTDGEGNTSFKSYDKSNNLISSKDALSLGSSPFNYVNSNLVKDETNTDYGIKSYTYNQNDQITSKSHGGRNCLFSNIDILGRTENISCIGENKSDSALSYNYQYRYDKSRLGRLDSVSSDAAHGVLTEYSYDILDRITGKTQTNKAITAWGGKGTALSVSYSYTGGGKNTSIKMPSGRAINYNYDGNKGRLVSVDIAGKTFISDISYNGVGQLSSWNIEKTGAHYAIGYNSAQNGSIQSITFNNKKNIGLYREEYGYDKNGRIVSINNLNGMSNTYVYDKSNRLIEENDNFYKYDKNGNRDYRIESSIIPDEHEYNGNRLRSIYKTKWGSGFRQKKIRYDFIEFNYLSTGEIFYYKSNYKPEYDGNGQMRYSGAEDGTYYMSYNHKNERTVRSSNTSGDWYSNAVQFVYDESSNLLGEYAPDGTPLVEYVWIDNRPVAAIYGTGESTKIYAVVTDHNNTPRMLVNNATDEIVWDWKSTAFGVGQPTGSVTFNLRFPGQYYDKYTGLHYNLNRYYNPELGRYMEPDPIGLEGGSNPYVYAGNNPISYVDPSGLDYSSGSWLGEWSNSISSQFSYSSSFPSDYFYGIPVTVGQANANLSFNGGSGHDIWVNANRLMVSPNGGWNLSPTTNKYRLPVEVVAYRNDSGNWMPSSKFTVPTSNDRGYWVFGELTMNSTGRLYDDYYNFERHDYNFSFSQGGINGIVGIGKNFIRNTETNIGANFASGGRQQYIDKGFSFHFFNQVICPTCSPPPKVKK